MEGAHSQRGEADARAWGGGRPPGGRRAPAAGGTWGPRPRLLVGGGERLRGLDGHRGAVTGQGAGTRGRAQEFYRLGVVHVPLADQRARVRAAGGWLTARRGLHHRAADAFDQRPPVLRDTDDDHSRRADGARELVTWPKAQAWRGHGERPPLPVGSLLLHMKESTMPCGPEGCQRRGGMAERGRWRDRIRRAGGGLAGIRRETMHNNNVKNRKRRSHSCSCHAA